VTTIKDIIGMYAFTSDGKRLDVTRIKGNVIKGSPVKQINGVWEIQGGADAECEQWVKWYMGVGYSLFIYKLYVEYRKTL